MIKTKKHIYLNELPKSPYYPEAHKFATGREIDKFGIHKVRILGAAIARNPHELLGTNTPKNIYVSNIVPAKPKWERKEVEYHEKEEQHYLKKHRR